MSFILVNGDARIEKDSIANLVYGIDVAGILDNGDSLSTVEAAETGGITISEVEFDGTVISARVSGGTPGNVASCAFRWTTTGGNADRRTIFFLIKVR